jgi:hypothetical protein
LIIGAIRIERLSSHTAYPNVCGGTKTTNAKKHAATSGEVFDQRAER